MDERNVKLQDKHIIVLENPVSRFLFEWFDAGRHKVTSEVWTGAKAGVVIQGFVKGAY